MPHAGLMYSGGCAARVFARTEWPRYAVLVGPNHSGAVGTGDGASLWAYGAFRTPLGDVPVAEELAAALAARSDLVTHDPVAHAREHSLEVELPFLQVLAPDSTIVPLLLAFDDWRRCRALARAVADAVRAWPERVLLVASSDMTHYESAAACDAKDRQALAKVAALDGEGLLDVCRRRRVTMCGRAAAAVVIEAARLLGATHGEVVDYRHSGWVAGDDASVVAYAGVVVQ